MEVCEYVPTMNYMMSIIIYLLFVKIISVFVLLIQSDSVFCLTSTTNNFYKDPDPISTTTQLYTDPCSLEMSYLSVPLLSKISNVLGADSMSTQSFDVIGVKIIMCNNVMHFTFSTLR